MHRNLIYSYAQLLVFATVVISVSMLDTIVPGFRYLKYLVPLFFVGLLLLQYNKVSFKAIHPVLFAFLLYAVWGVVVSFFYNGGVPGLGVNDFIFILSYIVPLAFFFSNKISIELLFKIFTIFFLVSCIGIPYQQFSIENSTAPFESSASFVFGAFALYFVFGRKWYYVALALLLMFLSLKRIALLAFIICLLVNYLPAVIRHVLLSKFSFLLLNSICAFLILGVGFGVFDDIILETTGLNVHQFTMGRFSHYLGIVEELEHNPWSIIWGNGIGSAYALASVHMETDGGVVNLHSDTLKILFETGVVVFLAFFILIGRSKKINSKILLLFLMILFFTDNVLIYLGTMFFILIIFMKLESE